MKKKVILAALSLLFCSQMEVSAHCQMPCGIYHDDVVYDRIDQYIETMYEGISVMNSSKFDSAKERNEFVRWVVEKEKTSDEAAALIVRYFLQQKIKTGEPDTPKKLVAAHELLFTLVAIKQNASIEIIESFSKEWDAFKLMFHREGYECEMEKIKRAKEEKKAALKSEEPSH